MKFVVKNSGRFRASFPEERGAANFTRNFTAFSMATSTHCFRSKFHGSCKDRIFARFGFWSWLPLKHCGKNVPREKRGMRAMRRNALESARFRPYFGKCTDSFLKVLSIQHFQATGSMGAALRDCKFSDKFKQCFRPLHMFRKQGCHHALHLASCRVNSVRNLSLGHVNFSANS